MNEFIIVFLSMLSILILTKYLLNEENNSNQEINLNFDKKIKCKCNNKPDISKYNNKPDIKENFVNYNKNIIDEQLLQNEDITKPIKEESKYTNLTAEKYFINNFVYPIKPLKVNNYVAFPSNAFKYMNIGNDTDKLI